MPVQRQSDGSPPARRQGATNFGPPPDRAFGSSAASPRHSFIARAGIPARAGGWLAGARATWTRIRDSLRRPQPLVVKLWGIVNHSLPRRGGQALCLAAGNGEIAC